MCTACGIMHRQCCRLVSRQHCRCIIPQAVHTVCAPEDGRNYRPKPVELIGIINKSLLLHLVGCLYYCISDARSYKYQIFKTNLEKQRESYCFNWSHPDLFSLKNSKNKYFKENIGYISIHKIIRCQPHLYPRSLVAVNILGSQKFALLLDVPKTCFNNWPDDDSMSRNMSPHL